MESHLSRRQTPETDLEIQYHDQNSPSNSDLGLFSPSLNEQLNNADEPLIRPALPPRPSTTTFSSKVSLSRKPVIPRRPPSTSSTDKLPEYVELRQLTPGEPDPRDPFADKPASISPKAFRKPQRYLGLDLGYWRQPARHFSIFAILAFVIIVPLYFLGWGFTSLQGYEQPAFTHDCIHYQAAAGVSWASTSDLGTSIMGLRKRWIWLGIGLLDGDSKHCLCCWLIEFSMMLFFVQRS